MSKADGKYIAIKFDRKIVGDVSGNENYFSITGQEYDAQPEGTLVDGDYQVNAVTGYISLEELLNLNSGELNRLSYSNGILSLEVNNG